MWNTTVNKQIYLNKLRQLTRLYKKLVLTIHSIAFLYILIVHNFALSQDVLQSFLLLVLVF